ncbi:MAG TPA: hypothetical protein VF518_07200 [Polyangia bacterium]
MFSRSTEILFGILVLMSGATCASTSQGRSGVPEAPKVGQSSTSLSGCLTKGSPSSEGADFAQAGAEVLPIPGGVVVTHNLIHGCCLTAKVTAAIERQMVIVHEKLTGEECKCDCPSTLRTAVGLAPGAWIVRLLLDTPAAHEQIVQDWDIHVRPR